MSPFMAHRDWRRFEGQPSLSGHCGHGPIFIAQGSVANDPSEILAVHRPTDFSPLPVSAVTMLYEATRIHYTARQCLGTVACARAGHGLGYTSSDAPWE